MGRDAQHVDGAHAGGQQRLVGIAEGGIGHHRHRLLLQPAGDGPGAVALEDLAHAVGHRQVRQRRRLGRPAAGRTRTALHLRVAVHDHLADVVHQLGRVGLRQRQLEQLRRLVDEAGVVVRGQEARMGDHRRQELQVGLDAAYPELSEGAAHALHRLPVVLARGGDLHQQAVVVAGDDRAGIGGARVQPDAGPRRAAVGDDAAEIRDEVVARVFRGHPALQRRAAHADVGLGRDAAGGGITDAPARGDLDLRLDDVEASHLLGDGVFHLHPRVDLDEVVGAGLGVLQELHRAGVGVVHRAGEPQRSLADILPARLVQIGRRRALHHLLMAALHRAVALEQVDHVAVLVAEHLHLHVAGIAHQLLEVHLVVAERGLRLPAGHFDLAVQLALVLDDAHAPAAAAPARLQHHRIADLVRHPGDLGRVVRQRLGGGHYGHVRGLGDGAGLHLVAEPAHHVGLRADEGDAGRGAGLGEVRVLGQEAVARMHRIAAGLPRHPQHLVDVEIRAGRRQAVADAVGLVAAEAVQREVILVGIHVDRLEPQLIGGTHDPDGDLAPVRDQDLADSSAGHFALRGPS